MSKAKEKITTAKRARAANKGTYKKSGKKRPAAKAPKAVELGGATLQPANWPPADVAAVCVSHVNPDSPLTFRLKDDSAFPFRAATDAELKAYFIRRPYDTRELRADLISELLADYDGPLFALFRHQHEAGGDDAAIVARICETPAITDAGNAMKLRLLIEELSGHGATLAPYQRRQLVWSAIRWLEGEDRYRVMERREIDTARIAEHFAHFRKDPSEQPGTNDAGISRKLAALIHAWRTIQRTGANALAAAKANGATDTHLEAISENTSRTLAPVEKAIADFPPASLADLTAKSDYAARVPPDGVSRTADAPVANTTGADAPTPELARLAERAVAMVREYDGTEDDHGDATRFSAITALDEEIRTFEARGTADVALKIRAAEYICGDPGDLDKAAKAGDRWAIALSAALSDLTRLASIQQAARPTSDEVVALCREWRGIAEAGNLPDHEMNRLIERRHQIEVRLGEIASPDPMGKLFKARVALHADLEGHNETTPNLLRSLIADLEAETPANDREMIA